MKNRVIGHLAVALFFIFSLQALAQTFDKGLYITSKGTVKGLTIFIQFLGDNSHPESTEWPINQEPLFLNTFLDSTANQTSTPYSFSGYYKEMSLGLLKFYGKGYFIIAPHTERYYTDTLGIPTEDVYGYVTKEVLNTLNSQINYAEYDNWTFGSGSHTNSPDGSVDLIIVLYRNSTWPPGEPVQGIANLAMTDTLDGKTIHGGFPGSGITNSGGYAGMKRCALSMKHEFGHLLLSGFHPKYSNHNHQGLAADGMSGILMGQGNVATGWERERLGWINYTNVTANQSYSLTDFVTTGKVLKISIPGTDEAFLIQNHQKLSIYDDPNTDRSGKGLFIYHVYGMTSDVPTYDVEVAEGKYNWSVPYWYDPGWGGTTNPFSLPVFKQGVANPNGVDGRDWLPTDKPLTVGPFKDKYLCAFFFSDNNGQPQLVDRYQGDPKDAYDLGYNQVFSPWSNPNTDSWGAGSSHQTSIAVEITGKHAGSYGEDIYDLNICVNNPEQVSPSKPINVQAFFQSASSVKVYWNLNIEPNMTQGSGYGYDVYISPC
jgi:M6 family metalloprotease-like protein